MATGLGLSNLSFNKPQTLDEMRLVLSIGKAAAQRHGKKPSAEIKRQVQEEISGALQQSRSQGQAAAQQQGGQPDPLTAVPFPDVNDPQFLGTAQPAPARGLEFQPGATSTPLVDPTSFRSDSSFTNLSGSQLGANLAGPLSKHPFQRPGRGLFLEPEAIDPSILERRGQAFEDADDQFGFGDFSTFDKIAGGAGLAAAGIGAFLPRGSRARGPLGAVSKFGLGRALGAPERHRAGLDRTLRNELGATQAGIDQFGFDAATNQESFGRDVTRGEFLQNFADLREAEAGREAAGGRASGAAKIPKTLKEELAGIRFTGEIPSNYKQYFRSVGITDPNAQFAETLKWSQLLEVQGYIDIGGIRVKAGDANPLGIQTPGELGGGRGGFNPDEALGISKPPTGPQLETAETRLKKAQTQQQLQLREALLAITPNTNDWDELTANWPIDAKGKRIPPTDAASLSDLRARALSSDLRKSFSSDIGLWNSDTLGVNANAVNAIDSLMKLDVTPTEFFQRNAPARAESGKAGVDQVFGTPAPPTFEASGLPTQEAYDRFRAQWPTLWGGMTVQERSQYRNTGEF